MTVNTELKNLIDQANTRATTLRSDAASAISNATKLIGEAGKELPKPVKIFDLPADPAMPQVPTPPVIQQIDLDPIPPLPNRPAMLPVSVAFPSAPTVPTVNPQVTAPNRPGNTPTLNATMPSIKTDFQLPPQPSPFSGPTPTAASVTLPQAPSVSIPSFSGSKPADVGPAPSASSAFNSAWTSASASFTALASSQVDAFMLKANPQYASQLNALENKLAEFISGQTETGMSPDVEQAIYARSQSKQDAESKRVADEAISRAARMGFTMPSGALMGSMQKARQAAADNNAAAAREIVVMKSELQQKNLQFAMTTSAQLRQTMVNAWLSYHSNVIQLNGQATQYAQGVADALVKTYGMAVDAFRARLDAYRADASVYESMVRASLAQIEIFKARIEGEMAKVKVNEAQVQVYKAQVDAHASAVQAYRANVDAIATIATLEKSKLEAFEVQVRAYTAQVEAYRSEWQAYSAAWNGEEAKVNAEIAKVRVYQAQSEGFKAHVSAEGIKADSTAKTNDTNLRAYEAEVRAWAEQVRAYAAKVTARIDAQKSLVGAYQVGSQAALGQANAVSERYRALASTRQAQSELESRNLLETAKIRLSAMDASADTSISAAQVLRGLAESTMAGINTLVTVKEDFTA